MTREWTGRHILITLIATFGVVFAVNGYLHRAGRAHLSRPGCAPSLSAGHGIQPDARRTAPGRKPGLAGHASAARSRQTAWRPSPSPLKDKAGAPVSGEALTGELRHPMDEERDHAIAFQMQGQGIYVGHVPHVDAGRWDVGGDAQNRQGGAVRGEAPDMVALTAPLSRCRRRCAGAGGDRSGALRAARRQGRRAPRTGGQGRALRQLHRQDRRRA